MAVKKRQRTADEPTDSGKKRRQLRKEPKQPGVAQGGEEDSANAQTIKAKNKGKPVMRRKGRTAAERDQRRKRQKQKQWEKAQKRASEVESTREESEIAGDAAASHSVPQTSRASEDTLGNKGDSINLGDVCRADPEFKEIRKRDQRERKEARKILERAEKQRDIRFYNRIINDFGNQKQLGYALQAYNDALGLGEQVNAYTFTNAINACVRCGEMDRAESFLAAMKEHNVLPNEVTFTVLLKGYANLGDLDKCQVLLREMLDAGVNANVRTLNALLRGCVKACDLESALSLEAFLEEKGVAPDIYSLEYIGRIFAMRLEPEKATDYLKRVESFDFGQNSTRDDVDKVDHSEESDGAHSGLENSDSEQHEAVEKKEVTDNATAQKDTVRSRDPEAEKEGVALSMMVDIASAYSMLGELDHALQLTKAARKRRQLVFNNLGKSKARRSVKQFLKMRAKECQRDAKRVLEFIESCNKGIGRQAETCSRGGIISASRAIFVRSRACPIPRAFTCSPSVIDPIAIMARRYSRVCIELCSGHGEWIAKRASEEPDTLWISIEIRLDRVFNIWKHRVFDKLQDNILLIGGEGLNVLKSCLPSGIADEFFINYPDPPIWLGSSQRLMTEELFREVSKVLRPAGALTIVTDHGGYALQTVRELLKVQALFTSTFAPKPWSTELPQNYGSSYFDRFWTNGERTSRYYLCYKKVKEDEGDQ